MIYIYIWLKIEKVVLYSPKWLQSLSHTHTHTTHYIIIYICVGVIIYPATFVDNNIIFVEEEDEFVYNVMYF